MSNGYTYVTTFDGIKIDVLSASVSHGRRTPQHEFPKRDGAGLEDQGRRPWRCTMQILFFDHPAATDYEQRFREFSLLVDSGDSRVLVHPYEGAVICKLVDFSHQASGDEQTIFATVTFVEDIARPPVFAAGAGAQPTASAQDVRAEALLANAALEAADLSSDLPLEAIESSLQWANDPELSARSIQLQAAVLNNRLNTELSGFEAATDIAKHPIYKQYTLLQYSIRRAAESFTSTTRKLVTLSVTEPTPLRVIAARFYGARDSERRVAELLDLNTDLRNPALVAAGTELRAYSKVVDPGQLS